MSETDIDRLPRMKDTLTPADLDTEACVALATEVLRGLAEDLATAARQTAASPTPENLRHLKSIQKVYRSDWFAALSCGVIDGETAMRKIIKDALHGREVKT